MEGNSINIWKSQTDRTSGGHYGERNSLFWPASEWAMLLLGLTLLGSENRRILDVGTALRKRKQWTIFCEGAGSYTNGLVGTTMCAIWFVRVGLIQIRTQMGFHCTETMSP